MTESELHAIKHFIAAVVDAKLAAIPRPERGEKGEPGEKGMDGAVGPEGTPGANGRDGLPGTDGTKGMDGKDGRDGVDGERGTDGAPGLAGEPGLRGEKGMDGTDGKDGRDGRDGKDGITERQMDEAVALAVAKALPDALTVAVHDAVTKALADYRLMTYKGVWTEGEYEPGHTVTWAGSLWHCNTATTSRPGEGSKDWTLAAKRGRDGKDRPMRVTQPLTDEAINANARARYFKTAGVPVSGCTRTSPRCPDAREYSVDLRECCKGHLRQIVRDVAAALNELGHVWWADYGTLLGAVRNAGIIPHDKDVDLGMLWPKRGMTALREIEARLKKQGYDISIRRGGDNLKVRLSSTNLTNADLFMWHERADGTMHRTRYVMGVDRYKGRDFRKEDAFPLATVEWEGMTLPAPKNPAAFCAFRYGPTWQTPIRRNHDGVVRGESR